MLIVGLHCRAYPDEKGIETDGICQDAKNYWFPIAEPIPMKRELKRKSHLAEKTALVNYCRAYPDEKGIETRRPLPLKQHGWKHCRAYPDEKGIETPLGSRPPGSQPPLQSLSR